MRPVLNPEGVTEVSPGSKPARSVATTRGTNPPLRSTRYPWGRHRRIILSLPRELAAISRLPQQYRAAVILGVSPLPHASLPPR